MCCKSPDHVQLPPPTLPPPPHFSPQAPPLHAPLHSPAPFSPHVRSSPLLSQSSPPSDTHLTAHQSPPKTFPFPLSTPPPGAHTHLLHLVALPALPSSLPSSCYSVFSLLPPPLSDPHSLSLLLHSFRLPLPHRTTCTPPLSSSHSHLSTSFPAHNTPPLPFSSTYLPTPSSYPSKTLHLTFQT